MATVFLNADLTAAPRFLDFLLVGQNISEGLDV